MVSLGTIRTTIATALNAVDGLRDVPDDGTMTDRINLPTCLIQLADDAQAMNLTQTEFYDHLDVILVYSKAGGNRRADAGLMDLYEDVVAALNGVGAVNDIKRQGYGDLEVQGVPVLGAILRVEVLDQ